MAAKRKPKKMPRCGYLTTTGFWTTQGSWEVDDSTYVTIYDQDDKEYARVLRYEEAKELGVEYYRKRIPRHVWHHLAGRAIFALDPFHDGTPIEQAVKIPRELRPFVARHVETRERKKAERKAKAQRDAMRARGEIPPRKPRARKTKKAG
jgi:hypothetical protein